MGKLGCHVFRAIGIPAHLQAADTFEMPKPWPHTARALASFTTAPATEIPPR